MSINADKVCERHDHEESPGRRKSKMPAVHITFDDMLEELGELGRFQITTYILVCFPVLFAAANSLSYLFVAGKPEYRCFVPNCDVAGTDQYWEPWLPNALPSISKKRYIPAECQMYEQMPDLEHNSTFCPADYFMNVTVTCHRWVYRSGEKTIFHEWNMFCRDTWKLPFVGTMHFAGIVAGSAIFGVLADTFGRKSVFIFCILLMNVSGVAQVLCPDYNTFIIFIFINALGTSGVYPLAFIIGVELVGKKRRELTGIALNYFYAIGEALIGIIAYFFRDWVVLQLVISAPPAIFVVYYWLIPESVRWLLATKRTEQATGIIKRAAKTNGVVLSETLMTNLCTEQVQNMEKKLSENNADVKMWGTIKEMLFSKKLILRILIVFFIWTANVFTFYGLSVNSVNMSGNKYLNFILTSLAGIPGYTLAWFTIHKFGRRISLSGSLMLCAISNAAVIFVPPGLVWLEISMYLVAKMFVTSSLGIVYIYTAEMLPTVIRSAGVGAASTISRLGAMVAPFVPFIDPSIVYLPMMLFASISAIASVLTLCLPETIGLKLPETAQEAKDL